MVEIIFSPTVKSIYSGLNLTVHKNFIRSKKNSNYLTDYTVSCYYQTSTTNHRAAFQILPNHRVVPQNQTNHMKDLLYLTNHRIDHLNLTNHRAGIQKLSLKSAIRFLMRLKAL